MPDLEDFARRYTAAWCSQDPRQVAAHFAPEGSLAVNGGSPAIGTDAVAGVAQSFMTAFPDLKVELLQLIPSGDRVEYHWRLTGTHTNGRAVDISGFESWRLDADGRIAESLGQFDAADYHRQLGQAT